MFFFDFLVYNFIFDVFKLIFSINRILLKETTFILSYRNITGILSHTSVLLFFVIAYDQICSYVKLNTTDETKSVVPKNDQIIIMRNYHVKLKYVYELRTLFLVSNYTHKQCL